MEIDSSKMEIVEKCKKALIEFYQVQAEFQFVEDSEWMMSDCMSNIVNQMSIFK